MRYALATFLFCLAGALPCQSQSSEPVNRPRYELPVTLVLDTTLLPPARIVAVGPTGIVTAARRPDGGVRYYSRGPVRFEASLLLPPCALGLSLSRTALGLGRLRTDSTWVYQLDPLGARCVPKVAPPPTR